MTALARWCVVALGVVLLVAAPSLLRARPARDNAADAQELWVRVEAAEHRPYSGYVETHGAIQLPVTSRFTDIGDLLGGVTEMRVWWRDAESWRVDKLMPTGETDLIRQGSTITEWSYEDERATVFREPEIRLPRSSDLVPPMVGARVLRGADPASAARLDPRRVAGIDAPGLRVRPRSPVSSIDHADLWVDPYTGVPLAVEVFARDGGSDAAFVSEFESFSSRTPPARMTTFELPAAAGLRYRNTIDIADAASRFAPFAPPSTVAGLARSDTGAGAVGVYGDGLSQLVVIPLRDREARPLRDHLRVTPGSKELSGGISVAVGPLHVLLTGCKDDTSWLLAGTIEEDAVEAAANRLVADTVRLAEAP